MSDPGPARNTMTMAAESVRALIPEGTSDEDVARALSVIAFRLCGEEAPTVLVNASYLSDVTLAAMRRDGVFK